MAAKILHKKSNTVSNGVPSLPSPSILDYGEIAINYHEGNETISIKNDAGNIATFKSSAQIEENFAFEKTQSSGTVSTLGNCTAVSAYSFAVGESTITKNEYESAFGSHNVSNTGSTDSAKTAYSVGIGTSATSKNAVEVMRDGGVYVYGVGNYDGANANQTSADTLQTYLEKKEYVIATSLNDLNDDITELANSVSSVTASLPDMSQYVAKSGDTMDTDATLMLTYVNEYAVGGPVTHTNYLSGQGVTIDTDDGGSAELTTEHLYIRTNGWYGANVEITTDGINLAYSPMVEVRTLSFPESGGTIALVSDIPVPVSALTSACTHSEFPSAKVVYDTIVDNEYVVATAINTLHTEKEDVSNKVTAITSSATQTQYPSAKAVHDAIDGITGLPAVTAADNGKILKVVNGAWALVDPVTIYSGASAPSSDLGEDGDIYLQTS